MRGDADLRVAVDTYDVWISHGPEWDTARERVTIKARPTAGAPGKLDLHVRVRAANWISVSKLTVLGPGNTVLATRVIPPSTQIVRLDETIELEVSRDGYAILRVDGDRPMAPNVGDIGSFLVYPMAVTNPIWIDGDGKVTPVAPYPHD